MPQKVCLEELRARDAHIDHWDFSHMAIKTRRSQGIQSCGILWKPEHDPHSVRCCNGPQMRTCAPGSRRKARSCSAFFLLCYRRSLSLIGGSEMHLTCFLEVEVGTGPVNGTPSTCPVDLHPVEMSLVCWPRKRWLGTMSITHSGSHVALPPARRTPNPRRLEK